MERPPLSNEFKTLSINQNISGRPRDVVDPYQNNIINHLSNDIGTNTKPINAKNTLPTENILNRPLRTEKDNVNVYDNPLNPKNIAILGMCALAYSMFMK